MMLPSPRIETRRLVLRCWEPADAPLLKDAIDTSLDHLRPWMPWAWAEPSELAVIEKRLERFHADFHAGRDSLYAIFDRAEQQVLGGTGLRPRVGPGALEIGYWIRASATRQGYATEAADALTRHAFADLGMDRVEIRCDPANVASAAIPRRLAYTLREILRGNATTGDGRPRDTMVWELREDIRRIQERVARLPVRDPRTPEDVLGYDENGLPA